MKTVLQQEIERQEKRIFVLEHQHKRLWRLNFSLQAKEWSGKIQEATDHLNRLNNLLPASEQELIDAHYEGQCSMAGWGREVNPDVIDAKQWFRNEFGKG